ncbi:MAG TPA: DUF47 family protein [Clostridiaceae bacterium]|nr:DUF47 family protein [Clostridiaceae bacterium]
MKMTKKEVNYFDMFIQIAGICNKAAKVLGEMICDAGNFDSKAQVIHDIEHEGDELYHTLYRQLNRSFITPIEREDILAIARNIEDTIDAIDEVAIMFNILSISSVRPEAKDLVKLIVKSSSVLVEATKEFKNYKKSKELTPLLVELNHIEEEGDKLYQNAIKTLFKNEKDILEVVKWKNIFGIMEDVLDACENAAEVMEGVIIKNS